MEPVNGLTLSGTDVTATDRAQGRVRFVGTATVLLRYAGFTILTDPNFLHRGDHVHLGHGMTATRMLAVFRAPAVDAAAGAKCSWFLSAASRPDSATAA